MNLCSMNIPTKEMRQYILFNLPSCCPFNKQILVKSESMCSLWLCSYYPTVSSIVTHYCKFLSFQVKNISTDSKMKLKFLRPRINFSFVDSTALFEYHLWQELCEQELQVWFSEKYKEIDKNRLKLSKKIVGESAKNRTH